MYRLAHLSDLHATPVRVERLRDFVGKRFLGWLSWQVRRGKTHRPEVLEALIADLHAQAPDHVAITGDLTNVACLHEFPLARAWLEKVGAPRDVSLVPGNHDAYVAVPREASWDLWTPYLASDVESDGGGVEFPTLRERGPVALVGLCSANPTAPGLASGTAGAAQLERTRSLLEELGRRGLFRVVSIHHPINEGTVSARRALTDAAALRAILARVGAELVLHGHGHRQLFEQVPGPDGPIPVVGVRSASDVGEKEGKRAQYHVYEIGDPPPGGGRRPITARIRGWDPATGGCVDEGARELV
jgi:3',5'-cyclic AMP phosphodiesterase CpdA